MDVSIIIVHYNTPGLLRQTLLRIRKAAPAVKYEVLVVDNNPEARINHVVQPEFPEVKLITSDINVGFGQGVNLAFAKAKGRYMLVFNPDISMQPGSLEILVDHLDQNPETGIVGAQLKNPNGTIQHSCYRFTEPKTVAYRRIPYATKFGFVKEHLDNYLMADWDHASLREVDYILGACMMVRRKALEAVGTFDPGYFIYFEEQDLCRRFWKAGWRVVYHPESIMIHYHRRESAEGNFVKQLFNPLTHEQIKSAIYYFRKFKGESNPRHDLCRTA